MAQAELRLLVVGAGFHVLQPGEKAFEQTASSIVIARVGRLQDLHVLGGEDVAPVPASHPRTPQKK